MGTPPKNCGLLGGNENAFKLKTTAKLKDKKNIDPHGPRPIPNVCHLPDLPWFSLLTTFK
jgi:hypothetical protein